MERPDYSPRHLGRVLAEAVERRAKAAQDGITRAGRFIAGRLLTNGERREIRWMFGDLPGLEGAHIFPRNYWWPYPNKRAMAPREHIYFSSEDYREDFSLPGVPIVLRALFMHEATHLYQHHRLGISVLLRGPFDRGYDYILEEGKPLSAYRLEQMGQIVQDYYALRHGYVLRRRYTSLAPYADALPVRR